MTSRTFWTIIIKIIGIWFVLDSLMVAYQFISYLFIKNNTGSLGFVLATAGLAFLTVLFYFLVLYLCVFRTDWIIDKLKLDKGFKDERIEINLHRSTILSISLIVIGGLLIIDNFPKLCQYIVIYFQRSGITGSITGDTTWSIIFLYFFKTLIGYFLITSSGRVVAFI
jgi:uncharacterized membrane protein